MKIDLDVLHSCSIKRKKPWPKVSWLGREKQQLFLFDYQRISILDPKTGKTKRKVNKITSLLKNVISMNLSDSKLYLIGILSSGDIFIWNKDTEVLKYVEGTKDFAYKLGFHFPSVYISDDSSKLLVVTSRNKVFVFESDYSAGPDKVAMCTNLGASATAQNPKNSIPGNWTSIVAPKDIKTVEDNKELVLSARFNASLAEGATATCCFVFNSDNQFIVTILRVSWLNPGEIVSLAKPRFETLWTTHFPQLITNNICPKFEPINSRGAYVCRLSYSSKLLALAINQKLMSRSCLVFLSPINGAIFQANLRNFGLNDDAKGRHYWIQELNWMYNDLYLAGITRHGAIFIVSRLGNPVLIHATGSELSMGPALYITLHPLIVIKRKNETDVTSNTLNSTAENEDPLRQRYSLSNHPSLPIFVCSDGYLTIVFSFKAPFINQSRLLREYSHEATRLANSVLPDKHRKLKLSKSESKVSLTSHSMKIPDWGLQTGLTLGSNNDLVASSFEDSGVENDNNNKPSVTDGKIIFSYIPQILPISFEKLETNTIASKLEALYEITQNSWNLLSSSYSSAYNRFDYEPAVNSIRQLLSSYTNVFINLNYANFIDLNLVKSNPKLFRHLKQLFNDGAEEFDAIFEECKLKSLMVLYLNLFKALYFDTCEYRMFIHVARILGAIVDSLLKNETLFKSIEHTSLFQTLFVFLSLVRSFLNDIYKFNVNEQLFVNMNQIIEDAKVCKSTQKLFAVDLSNTKFMAITRNDALNEEFNFDKLVDSQEMMADKTSVDYLMEFGWKSLLRYTSRYHKRMMQIKAKNFNVKNKITSISYLMILIERNLKSFNQVYSISKSPIMKVSSGDELYYNGNLDAALNVWKAELNKSLKADRMQQKKCLRVAHKIFYACVSNYELKKFILILNDYLANYLTSTNDDSEMSEGGGETQTRVNLTLNTFTKLEPPKPLYISHPAIICLLETFARFMTLYFMNKSKLLVYSINNPQLLPNIIETCESKGEMEKSLLLKNEISSQRLTSKLKNDKFLQKIFNIDKALELLLLCGLYDEAIYFTYSINDWKSTFLLSSILKESQNELIVKQQQYLPDPIKCENLLTNKLCSILNLDLTNKASSNHQSKLFDKTQTENLNKILKDLLLCSVVTKINVLSPLLRRLLDILASTVSQLSAIIDRNFYLPAPPIYCTQMMTEHDMETDDARSEVKLRLKLSNLTKCIILLLQSSNLHVPLIKWYLQELNNCSLQMNTNFGIANQFYINNQLVDLLKSIRYQKLGYIPEDVLLMFRDFCTILFYLDLRDQFSHLLRRYTKAIMSSSSSHPSRYHQQHQEEIYQLCLSIIDHGNLMLSFRGFLKQQHVEVQDIILSSIARLTSQHSQVLALSLERKLATCVDKSPFLITSNGVVNSEDVNESFQNKLDSLLEKWKEIRGQFNTTLADIYVEHLNTKRASTVKLLTMFGLPEDVLMRVYLQKLPRSQPCLVGSYDYERSNLCTDFLEMFFKIGFNATESWENFVQCVNLTPLLPEFYEVIRQKELPNGPPDKSYIMTQSPLTRRFGTRSQTFLKSKASRSESLSHAPPIPEEPEEEQPAFYKGLFRKYAINSGEHSLKMSKKSRASSLTDLRSSGANKLRKTVSFHDLSCSSSDNVISNNLSINDDILQGTQPVVIQPEVTADETSDLFSSYKVLDYGSDYEQVIHLAIWLMKWTKSFNMIVKESKITYKIQSINANLLVASVYLANNLRYVSHMPQRMKKKQQRKQSSHRKSPRKPLNSNRSDVMNSEQVTSDDLTDVTTSLQQQQHVHQPLRQKSSQQISQIESSFAVSETNKSENITNFNQNHENRNEPHSPSSTLDISSLDEQEEMLLRKLQDTTSKTPSPTKQYRQGNTALDEYSNFTNITEPNRNAAEDLFKQQPRSPTKTPQYFDTKQFSFHSQQQESSPYMPTYQEPQQQQQQSFFPMPQPMMNAPIGDMIRDEMKKIVQLQHDTIMNILNGGSGVSPQMQYPFQQQQQQQLPFGSNIEKNLMDQLKYVSNMSNPNGEPIEFIIETKVKTAGAGPQGGFEMQNKAVHIKTPHDEYDGKSHFMKTFDYEKKQAVRERSPEKRSNPLGIPLLSLGHSKQQQTLSLPHIKEAWASSKQEPVKAKSGFSFPLLSLTNARKDRSPVKYDHVAATPHIQPRVESTVEGTLQVLKTLTKVAQPPMQNIRLLQLHPRPTHEVEIAPSKPKTPRAVAEEEHVVGATPTRERKSTPVEMESKGVEAMKPLYDGYIIKPGAFEELLPKEDDKTKFTSAEAHYQATEHIRRVAPERPVNKKEMFTMTDNLPSGNVVAPDILFKLKFDPLKKGRENNNNADFQKDFVNVADLDSAAVEDILKLIEREQDKRNNVQVVPSSKPRPVAALTNDIQKTTPTRDTEPAERELELRADVLTEQLLKDEEQLNYDLLHDNLISSHARTKSRQTVLDEFKLLDKKIKIMNDIAGEIGSDYAKYNKMVDTIQDFNKIVDMAHDYPIGSKEIPKAEEIVKLEEQQKEEERKRTKFYMKKDADKNIEQYKEQLTRPPIQKPVREEVVKMAEVEDDDLSDLRADEEDRLKKILNIDDVASVSHLIKDVFDETEHDATKIENVIAKSPRKTPRASPPRKPIQIEGKSKFYEKQQLEFEQKRQKNREKMEAERKRGGGGAAVATISNKSPTRHDVKSATSVQASATTQPSPRLNTTYKVPTSNLVQLEKEMAQKRELKQQQYANARAYEAQLLMNDITVGNIRVSEGKKEMPATFLDLRSIQQQATSDEKKPPKVDLMTKTIIQLQKEENQKRYESNVLLQELEERARKSHDPKQPSPERQIKPVKSFTNYVHLQDPDKLKHTPVNPPITYSERLQLQQEAPITKPSPNEIYKIYGTKRVPGIYESYTKQEPRKIKTYQERVRELRPDGGTVKPHRQPTKIPIRIPKKRSGSDIRKGKTYAQQLQELQANKHDKTFIVKTVPFKQPPQKRHDLKPKTRIEYKKEVNRFQPYKSPYVDYTEAADEVSPWSIDDNMKNILYDKPKPKTNKRATYKDMDQETLADTDDYLQAFGIGDEPNQREIDRLLRDNYDDDDDGDDYTQSVNIDDLKNLVSLSTETVSYIDWDQIDRILQD